MFPFLAVLICTMGALVPLLLAMSRTARQQAEAAALAKMSEQGAEVQGKVDDVRWRVEQLKQSRKQTESQKVDARLELGHLEDHARQLRGKLAQYEKTIGDLEKLDNGDRGKVAQSQAELERVRSLVESAKQRLAHSQQTGGSRPRSYAVVPYEGPNQTHRRPIYLECRADSVVLQPEGIELNENDFEGPLGPGNPLAAAVRAAREYMLGQKEFDPEAGEPYPMLLVRPEGITAYYAAREAMKSWGADFGYELIENDWKLAYPPADPRLAEVAKQAVASGRVSQARLAAAAPRQYKPRPKTVYRASNRGGFVAESAGNDDDGGGRGGYTRAQPSGSVGRRYGSGGSGGDSDGRTYHRAGTGSAQDVDNNPYAAVVLGPNGGVASANNGVGGGAVGGNGGVVGGNGGSGGVMGGNGGTGSAMGGGSGGGSIVDGGSGSGGAMGGGSGTGSAMGGGSGGGSMVDGGSGTGGVMGGNGNAMGGGSGSGSMVGGGSGTGGMVGGNGGSGGAMGGDGGSGSGTGMSGSTIGVADNGPALSGNAAGGGVASGMATGNGSGAACQGASTSGAYSATSQGTRAGNGASQNSGTAASGQKSTTAIVQPDGYVVGQPPREEPVQPIVKKSSMPDEGPTQPGYALRPGEWQPTPEPPPKRQPEKEDERFGRKPKKSLAENRGEDWGLRNPARGTVGVTRPIRVECHADSLVIISDRSSMGNKVIALGPNTEASIDKLIGIVWDQMESWGMAGRGMYWRPVLQVQVDPDAEHRFEDLATLLDGSGITVRKKL